MKFNQSSILDQVCSGRLVQNSHQNKVIEKFTKQYTPKVIYFDVKHEILKLVIYDYVIFSPSVMTSRF